MTPSRLQTLASLTRGAALLGVGLAAPGCVVHNEPAPMTPVVVVPATDPAAGATTTTGAASPAPIVPATPVVTTPTTTAPSAGAPAGTDAGSAGVAGNPSIPAAPAAPGAGVPGSAVAPPIATGKVPPPNAVRPSGNPANAQAPGGTTVPPRIVNAVGPQNKYNTPETSAPRGAVAPVATGKVPMPNAMPPRDSDAGVTK